MGRGLRMLKNWRLLLHYQNSDNGHVWHYQKIDNDIIRILIMGKNLQFFNILAPAAHYQKPDNGNFGHYQNFDNGQRALKC